MKATGFTTYPYLKICCALAALAILVLGSPVLWSQTGAASDLRCDDPVPIGGLWDMYQCYFPGESIYVPNNVPWDYPAAFLVPRPLPEDHSLRLRLQFAGYSAKPYSCTSPDFSAPGYIVVKNCPGHFPDVQDHAVGGLQPLGWWGQFFGDSSGIRLAVSLAKAVELWDSSIDKMAGVMLKGNSYGGTGALLQSMVLPDPVWRDSIAIVWADVPNTLFVKKDPIPGDGMNESGMYWRDPAVRLAWGNFDISKADLIEQANALQHIYYRVNGSPADSSVIFDLDFFTDFCNAKKVACFGTWHDNGHSIVEQGIDLPFLKLYSGAEMDVRLDQILPVFTNSTANHWGPRGHYNLGLEWGPHHLFVDRTYSLRVPVRYRRRTGMGGDIPDQPASVTFDLTLRRVENFDLPLGTEVAWTIGKQSGFATVTREGEITIEGITLDSSTVYSELQITPNFSLGCN